MLTQEDVKLIQTALKPQFEIISQRLDVHDQLLNRLVAGMVDLQARMKDVEGRMAKIEATVHNVFDKIDGFLGVLKKQDMEHQALRMHVVRLEERIVKLEQQLAT